MSRPQPRDSSCRCCADGSGRRTSTRRSAPRRSSCSAGRAGGRHGRGRRADGRAAAGSGAVWEAPAGPGDPLSVALRPRRAGAALARAVARRRRGGRGGARAETASRRRCAIRTTSSSPAARSPASSPRRREGRVVLGIGVNVNQTADELPARHARSRRPRSASSAAARSSGRRCWPRSCSSSNTATTRGPKSERSYTFSAVNGRLLRLLGAALGIAIVSLALAGGGVAAGASKPRVLAIHFARPEINPVTQG